MLRCRVDASRRRRRLYVTPAARQTRATAAATMPVAEQTQQNVCAATPTAMPTPTFTTARCRSGECCRARAAKMPAKCVERRCPTASSDAVRSMTRTRCGYALCATATMSPPLLPTFAASLATLSRQPRTPLPAPPRHGSAPPPLSPDVATANASASPNAKRVRERSVLF